MTIFIKKLLKKKKIKEFHWSIKKLKNIKK